MLSILSYHGYLQGMKYHTGVKYQPPFVLMEEQKKKIVLDLFKIHLSLYLAIHFSKMHHMLEQFISEQPKNTSLALHGQMHLQKTHVQSLLQPMPKYP